jgi:hypothetical protein
MRPVAETMQTSFAGRRTAATVRTMPAVVHRHAILVCFAALALAACGGDGDREGAQPSTGQGSTPRPAPVLEALALLPDAEGLRRQVLYGDVDRLRDVYPDADELSTPLAGLWLPDALAGATRVGWPRRYGFGLATVEQFVAAGFHPQEVAVLTGRFRPAKVRSALRSHRYRRAAGVWSRGEDGSVDTASSVGRLALSALDRVVVTRRRLVGASTTALAQATLAPSPSLADDPDLAAAARALGSVTAAVILPAELVRPAAGVLVVPVAQERALLLAAGVDDQGATERVFRMVLVYATAAQAEREAERIAGALADADVPTRAGQRFSDLFDGLRASVVDRRAVLIEGRIVDAELSGVWRGLLETGDLAVLVPQD